MVKIGMPRRRSMVAAIFVHGPPGREAELLRLHRALPDSQRRRLDRIACEDDVTLVFAAPFFARIDGLHIRCQVLGLADAIRYRASVTINAGRCRGLLFIADARPEAREANRRAVEELRQSYDRLGRRLEELPLVLKRRFPDHRRARSIEELQSDLGLAHAVLARARRQACPALRMTWDLIIARIRDGSA